MKIKTLLSIILIVFIAKIAKSQIYYYQMLDENIIKVFYNSSADITIEKYADYYRIATIDPLSLLFQGEFTDFDIKGNKVFSGNFDEGKLNGLCTFFYEDNKVKEIGKYNHGVRDSIWTFYYSNGQIEKIISYDNGLPYVESLFKSNGKQLIINGTGEYVGSIYKDNGKRIKYRIKGELLKGKLNGKWKIIGVTQEKFNNGTFIEGFDVLKYTSPQQIFLENILGFYCQENLTLFQNKYFCNSCIDNISWALYSVSGNINNNPYKTFLSKYSRIVDSLNITNLSQLIEFKVNKNGTIDNIKTHNTNEALDEKTVSALLRSILWNPLQCDGDSDGYIYMMVVKYDGKIYLPQAIVITNNLEANFMVKQMNNNNLLMRH